MSHRFSWHEADPACYRRSEMPSDELLEKGGLNEGFQLWVNLPKAHKMAKPRYQYVFLESGVCVCGFSA